MAQPAHRPPTPARSDAEEGSGRGRTKGFFKQKGPFTVELTLPLRLRSGPGTPASPFREVTGTFGGSSGFDPRDDDGEWELPPGVPLTTRAADESRPHRADDRSRTALGARDDRRGPGHRPGKDTRDDSGRARDARGGGRDDRRPHPHRDEPAESRTLRHLADLLRATEVEMATVIAGVEVVTAVTVEETRHRETGKRPGQGGRLVTQSTSALD